MEMATMTLNGQRAALNTADYDRLERIFSDYLGGLDDERDYESDDWIRTERAEASDVGRRMGNYLHEYMTLAEREQYDHLDDD